MKRLISNVIPRFAQVHLGHMAKLRLILFGARAHFVRFPVGPKKTQITMFVFLGSI